MDVFLWLLINIISLLVFVLIFIGCQKKLRLYSGRLSRLFKGLLWVALLLYLIAYFTPIKKVLIVIAYIMMGVIIFFQKGKGEQDEGENMV